LNRRISKAERAHLFFERHVGGNHLQRRGDLLLQRLVGDSGHAAEQKVQTVSEGRGVLSKIH
jgi:hypothetical protein